MPNDERAKIWIVLDVFSGRPNPSWGLSERQVEELWVLLRSRQRESPVRPVEPLPLGYRGFTIINHEQLPGIPYAIRVYRGVLTVTEKSPEGTEVTSYIEDTNRIEEWLLEQIENQGYGRIME